MNATSIVLLIGVSSFWIAVSVFIALFLRLRITLNSIERTIDSMRLEMEKLTPVVEDTLKQVTDTGNEVSRTSAEARNLIATVNDHAGATVVGNAIAYLPAAVSAFKLIRPMLSRRKKKE